jgi:hypothetical protein
MNNKPVLKEDPNVVHPGYSYQPIKKHHEVNIKKITSIIAILTD